MRMNLGLRAQQAVRRGEVITEHVEPVITSHAYIGNAACDHCAKPLSKKKKKDKDDDGFVRCGEPGCTEGYYCSAACRDAARDKWHRALCGKCRDRESLTDIGN